VGHRGKSAKKGFLMWGQLGLADLRAKKKKFVPYGGKTGAGSFRDLGLKRIGNLKKRQQTLPGGGGVAKSYFY